MCVDLERVYATGISQGGGMAHHVACLAADIFAATAPVSSDLRTDPCMPVRPISEISFRGEADTLDAYGGGHVGPPGMAGYTAIGAKPTLERWKTIDMCTGDSVATDKLCETYTACAEGVEVSLCSIPGADHALHQLAELQRGARGVGDVQEAPALSFQGQSFMEKPCSNIEPRCYHCVP